MSSELENSKKEIEALKVEIELLKSQIQSDPYRVMFESSPDIIIKLDSKYNVIIIHIPGFSNDRLDTLIGKNIFDITPVFAHEKMAIAFEEVFQQGKTIKYESDGVAFDSYRYYENYLSPIKDSESEIQYLYFISREITAQKLAEKILIDSERKLKTVYENSIQILTILDLERRFTWFNKNALDRSPGVLGRALVIGAAAETYIEESQRPIFIENFNKAVKGEVVTYTRTVHFNNETIFIEYTLSPIVENAVVIGVALTGINVTKHKEYEDYLKRINLELVQQNEQLNQYSYIISHNLRGPIATLMGLVQVFDHCKDDVAQLTEIVQHIQKSAISLDTIIKDLNAVITQEDKEAILRTTIYLKDEYEGIIFLLSSQIDKAGAVIICNFEQCPTIHSIKSYIHSILYNLISNAIKYKKMLTMPQIRVSSYPESDTEICIECQDNGMGIDMEKFGDKLFGFYKRFHTHVEGKGLGLHLVKKQVELLGGRVEVQSVVNEGTIFKIFLPK